MHYRTNFILSYLCLLTGLLFSQSIFSQTVSTQIDAIINQQLPHATVGVFIQDTQKNQVLYSRNANKLLSPGSGTKLYTAAAALYQLKPDFHFLTRLSRKNQDYYITFTGSPSLTIDNLNRLLLNLNKNGVKIITGNVILDGTRYKPPHYPGDFSYDDLGWYYAAPSTAIILNENAETFDFISAKELGMPVQIKAKAAKSALTIINQVVTVSKEQEKQHCNLNIEMKPNNTLRLYGCLSQTKEPQEMKLAIPNPSLLAKQAIHNALSKQRILLKGNVINGKTPNDVHVISSMRSKNLTQLITHMLQESDNLYADSLYKQLAYATTGEGSFKQGAFAIKKILAQHTQLDMTQLELADGSGGRYNLVTAKQTVQLLSELYNNNSMQAIFLHALPQSGVSGTLQNRMKKTKLEKIIVAKTGTMHDITSLSGYIIRQNSKPIIFSIIMNNVNIPIEQAKLLEELILAKIV